MSNIVYVPHHYNRWAGALCGCFDLLARLLQCFHSYNAWKTFASKQREQAGTTGCHHIHLASWPRAAQGPVDWDPGAVSAWWAPSQASSPNYQTHRAYTKVTSTQEYFQYNKERDCIVKNGEPLEFFGGCGNSPGLDGLVNTIFMSPSISTWWAKALSRCSGLLARLLQCSGTQCPSPFWPKQMKQAGSTSALLYTPDLPTWNCSGWVDQCTGRLR